MQAWHGCLVNTNTYGIFFSRHIYPITCSSDQATDPESTNPQFISRKWVLFTLKLAFSITTCVYFDSQTKISFEQIKTSSKFHEINVGLVDSGLGFGCDE